MDLPSVWCVFQRLPGERCPSLAAICRTRAVADELVRGSEEDDRQQGKPASTWSVEQWSVLDGELKAIGDIRQISDVMDNMREGVLTESTENPDAGDPDESAAGAGSAEFSALTEGNAPEPSDDADAVGGVDEVRRQGRS
ncbi:MAG: hypothetical protein JWM27_1009 [Gemmatimonadetes bacterium]|nr:hypothetical protein [Gemmatimonadota bacterium]